MLELASYRNTVRFSCSRVSGPLGNLRSRLKPSTFEVPPANRKLPHLLLQQRTRIKDEEESEYTNVTGTRSMSLYIKSRRE